MNWIAAGLVLAGLATGAEGPAPGAPAYPQWDGAESIEQYAKRANLPPTKMLDLGPSTVLGAGDGVSLELVLIPAGTFRMGTPEPPTVDEEGYRSRILTGQVVLTVGGGALLVLLVVVLFRAIRKRQRPQYSLAWFLVMTVAAGVGLMGGLHWYFSARAFAQAQSEYEAALARFKSSDDWEKPAHDVTLTKPYYVGKYEITQEQYQEIMGNNPSRFKGRDLPVEEVLWEDAQAFCKKASEKTGSIVRLPTEAEWERACRAGTRTTYYTGDAETDLDRAGWYYENSKIKTHPVGRKTPNAWGVHDMHGNVWEWCADWLEAYKSDPAVDPQGTAQDQNRVTRGGSWMNDLRSSRSASRATYAYSLDFIGFRVVVVAPRTP